MVTLKFARLRDFRYTGNTAGHYILATPQVITVKIVNRHIPRIPLNFRDDKVNYSLKLSPKISYK